MALITVFLDQLGWLEFSATDSSFLTPAMWWWNAGADEANSHRLTKWKIQEAMHHGLINSDIIFPKSVKRLTELTSAARKICVCFMFFRPHQPMHSSPPKWRRFRWAVSERLKRFVRVLTKGRQVNGWSGITGITDDAAGRTHTQSCEMSRLAKWTILYLIDHACWPKKSNGMHSGV